MSPRNYLLFVSHSVFCSYPTTTIWNLYCMSKAFYTFPAHFCIHCASSFSIKKSPTGMRAFNFPSPHLQPYLYLLCRLTFLASILGTKMFLLLSPTGMLTPPCSHLLPSSHGPFPWAKQLLLKQTLPEQSVGKTSNWKLWKPFGWTIADLLLIIRYWKVLSWGVCVR